MTCGREPGINPASLLGNDLNRRPGWSKINLVINYRFINRSHRVRDWRGNNANSDPHGNAVRGLYGGSYL